MVLFLASLLRFVLNLFSSRRSILSENAVLWKENEILLRKVGKKRIHFCFYDRFFFVVLNRAVDLKNRLTLVKPETVLAWQRTIIRRFWTFERRPARRGRKLVDTMLGRRFYVFAVISHKTREIVRFVITENPTREFVRQLLILFSERMASTAYVIHDNAPMFNIDFLAYGLVSINTAAEAPNMNSIMERFFRTVRREALDNFLLLSRDQIQGILQEHVAFYNTQRPHQGIQQQIPTPGEPEITAGPIRKTAVLGGLHHHYFRQAA